MTGSLDTNIVLRLIMGDVPHQLELAKSLLETCHLPLRVDDAVFVEIEYALRKHYGMNRQQIAELLDNIITQPKISCSLALLSEVLPLYSIHPNLSFVDIYLTVAAEISNAHPLYTFDQNLAKHLKHVALLA